MAENNSEGYNKAVKKIREWKQNNTKHLPLDLKNLSLETIPEEIQELINLETLVLSHNNFQSFPITITKLTNLKWLSFDYNKILELPDEIGNLGNLSTLFLDNNFLAELPVQISKLTKLNTLSLSKNRLRSLPSNIGELSELQILYLNDNSLSSLPNNVGQLTNLVTLYLQNNNLTELPIQLSNLKNLIVLNIRDNFKLNIPYEIQDETPNTILNFYFENVFHKKREDIRPLKEVKVLIVGQGRVGKTSLVKYLIMGINCNPNEPSTHGIIRNKWKINVVEEKTAKEQDVQLNIWDFGGQDIQHQTHQFFLNQRSLYLLVLDAGRDEAGNKLDYWLKKIETVGKDAPILVAVNKSEQCLLPLAYTDLKEKFNIKGFFNISCETGQEIENLREAIKNEIGKIENVFEPIRKEWFAVKEYLENLEEDYISRDEYRRICRENGVVEILSQDTLLILLHELGVMLNFKEHETEVLNPEWVTRGVYQLVTSLDVQMNKGVLTPTLIESEIVKLQEQLHSEGKDYLRYPPEKYSFITDLMKKFELAYQIDETNDYFVPSLLPKDSPFVGEWNEKECAGFRYNYENGLLHETIMSRFIVKMKGYILNNTQWLTGVLLQNEHGNKALVKADLSNGYLNILIDGNEKTRREFLAIIRMKFNLLHKDNYPKQEIPLKEFPNEFVSYELLLQLEKEGIEESHTTVNGKLVKFNVKDLLDGVSTANKRALELQIDEIYHDKEASDRHYQEGLKRGEEIARKKNKEIDDILGDYGDRKNTEIVNSDNKISVANPKPSLIKTISTLVVTFVVILTSIGLYDYLQKQGYLSENGFYVALVFTVVFVIVIATFTAAIIGVIPASLIPDIIKPALGLIKGNNSEK